MTDSGKQLQLLSLPTTDLLDKFGSGRHKPGSGSAAALMALLACKLTMTVALLTEGKESYKPVHENMRSIRQTIEEELEPSLNKAFQDDSEAFDKVIQIRQARDAEKDEKKKRQLRDKALEELRTATEIPMLIAKQSLEIAKHALYIFDNGFQHARGDSGVAVSSAVSAAQGAAFVVYLNLTSFKEGAWAQEIRSECDKLMNQVNDFQRQLFSRVTKLQNEGIPEQLDLPLNDFVKNEDENLD